MIVAYWWNRRKNFGDLLTPQILKWVTGRPIIHSGCSPRLVSLGFVLAHAMPFLTLQSPLSAYPLPQQAG